VVQTVEALPRKCEALISNPRTTKKTKMQKERGGGRRLKKE
jgi:hypothetical protein